MSNIFVQPGETIMLQTGENQFSRLSYESLLRLVKRKGNKPGKKRASNFGGKLSHQTALVARAVRTGKWSTGAEVDVSTVVDTLISNFMNAPSEETNSITNKAVEHLISMLDSDAISHSQKTIINEIVAEVELRREECA